MYLLLFADMAVAGKWNLWVEKVYRNGYGHNSAKIRFCCNKIMGNSAFLHEKVCARAANGETICTDVRADRRLREGECVVLLVKFGSTRYPIDNIYIDD